MKNIYTLLSVLAFLFTAGSVSAQGVGLEVYIYPVALEQTTYTVGDTVKGEFTLHNAKSLRQSDVIYKIRSGVSSDGTRNNLIISDESEPIGPLYLEANSKRTIPFEYKLPSYISGTSFVQVVAQLKDGTPVASYEAPININGNPIVDTLSVDGASIVVNGDEFGRNSGPTVNENDVVSIDFIIPPTEKSYTLIPTIKLFNRVSSEEAVRTISNVNPIQTSMDVETRASLTLPVDGNPIVYAGQVSFEAQGVYIAPIDFRYIIEGPIATIRNINADALSLEEGQLFNVAVAYGGVPEAFNKDGEEVSNIEDAHLQVVVKNEKGEVIATSDRKIQPSQGGGESVFALTASAHAKNLAFEAYIKDANGNIISDYQTTLPSEKELKETYTESQDTRLIATIVGGLLIVVLIIVLARMFLRNKRNTQGVIASVLLSLVFVGGALIFVSHHNRADAQLSIESVYSGKNFGVTGVSSPLPATVRGYDPGETFQLAFSVLYGDCLNEGQDLLLRVPKADNPFTQPATWDTSNSELYYVEDGLGKGGFRGGAVGSQDGALEDSKVFILTPEWRDWFISMGATEEDLIDREGTFDPSTGNQEGWYLATSQTTYAHILHRPNVTYTAPSEPGIYKIYFQGVADGQDGYREFVASQTFCVNGAGLCEGEELVDMCPNIMGEQMTMLPGHMLNSEGECVPTDTPRVCTNLPSDPTNLGAACGCEASGQVGTIQCDGSCKTSEGQSILPSCLTCNDDHVAGDSCDLCGPNSGTWQCDGSNWTCESNGTVSCGSPDTPTPPVTPVVGGCPLITESSHCVQLYDYNGLARYPYAGIDQNEYDTYIKDAYDASVFSIGGVPITPQHVFASVSEVNGNCNVTVCEPTLAGDVAGCLNGPARCYSERVTTPYDPKIDIVAAPDFVLPGNMCTVTWTSQDTEYCSLVSSATGSSVLSYANAGTYSYRMGENSTTFTLSCEGKGSVGNLTNQAVCRTPGDFSEF